MKRDEVKKNKRRFLDALEKNDFHIGRTCKALGISRYTVYGWRKRAPEFANRLEFWVKTLKEDDRVYKARERLRARERTFKALSKLKDSELFKESEAGNVEATIEGLQRYGWGLDCIISPQERSRLEKEEWLNRHRRYHYFDFKQGQLAEYNSPCPLPHKRVGRRFCIREQPHSALPRFEAVLDSLKSYSLVEIIEEGLSLKVKVIAYLGKFHNINRPYDEAVRRGFKSALFEKV